MAIVKNSLTSCCGIKEKKCGCCKNLKITFQKTSDEKITYIAKIHHNTIVVTSNFQILFEISSSKVTTEIVKSKHTFLPPNSSYASLNIRNCTFII
ncbi:MAG: hypothetical protein HYR91_04385 [Flavobacteriia bacterium]|nr:hypothetical protein [Flavobacteriia bacterium]